MRGWSAGSALCRRTMPRRERASATCTLRSVKRWPASTWPEYGITW
jgi:hypothetical protein